MQVACAQLGAASLSVDEGVPVRALSLIRCAGHPTTVLPVGAKLQARLLQVFFALAAVGGFVLAAAPIDADAGMRAVGVAGIILGAGFWFWVTVLLNRRK